MEAIISGAVDVVRNYAISFAKEEVKSVWYLKDDIDRISQEVDTFIQDQGAMEAAEKKQLQDQGVRNWVRDLKNVRYDLEDVQCDYRVVVSAEDGQGVRTQWMRLVCGIPLSCLGVIPDPVIPRIEIAHRLKSINRNLVEINQRKAGLSLVYGGMVGEGNESDPSGPPMWTYQERPMIGRTETKIQIKEALLDYAGNEGSCSKLFVIGIVGAGGMGKTTLAHNIYNDDDVVKAFPKNNKWLYVGEKKIDIKRVMNEIIGEGSQPVSEDALHDAMREKFKDQSLLIVLDDVWCDNSDEWELLQSSLSKGAKAHALIVTTRNKAVLRAIRHDSKYSEVLLEGLPDTECMDIFERGAFKGDGAERYRDDLEGLSKRVVQKLKGIPLAATMMGTFLNKHLDNRRMWLNVVKDWPPNNEGDVVDRVVGLSYFHLPPDLKSCFAYCAMFPKGFKFDKETLVRMWIAQGYVQPPSRGVLMEHIGSDHFDDLNHRSFFQIVESRSITNYYIMHDLIHDFAQKVFTEGCRMDASDTEDGTLSEEIRHLSFYYNVRGQLKLERLDKYKKLRTLMLESVVSIAGPHLDVLAKFKYLRLLVLEFYELSDFPDSIRHLKFLRYLDISWTKISALPEFVCDLVELQYLLLPYTICALPEGMNKLISLRFIEAGEEEGFPQFKGIGQLTSLQGPLVFKVHNKSGWKISELKGLNHLHGRLAVRGLGNVTCKEEAEQACLTQKEYLEKLVLDWTIEEEEMILSSVQEEHVVVDGQVQQHVRNDDVEVEGQVLEGLFPPPNLKALSIENNRGARFPCWMEEHDPCPISSSLERLELVRCCKWECLPTLGRWPHLKELVIKEAHSVNKIGPEFFYGRGDNNRGSYFPRLEMLELGDMSLWEEWEMPAAAGEIDSSGGGGGRRHVFPSLKRLRIHQCPKLHSLSPILRHLTNLVTIEIRGCDELASLYDGCGSTPSPSRLKELVIEDCPKLASLAPFLLRHLTDLESIDIRRCDELASLYDGCGWTSSPSRLKDLSIVKCPKLASLAPFFLRHSTNLESIYIRGCAELASLYDRCESTSSPSRLKDIVVVECPKLASLAPFLLRHSTDLESIDIRRCDELASLYDGRGSTPSPSRLKKLVIEECPKLASLAPFLLRHSTNLQSIKIWCCDELASLYDGRGSTPLPSRLKELVIEECPKLASLAPILLRHSTNLESIEISKCTEEGDDDDGRGWMLPSGLEKLTVDGSSWKLLPCLSHLTALLYLEISGFPNLRCIPPSVLSLRSLKELDIFDCPAMERLPDGGLPPSLKSLSIFRCPLLEVRCREGGPERPKIPTTTDVSIAG